MRKKLVRVVLALAGATMVVPMLTGSPAGATEVCGDGHVVGVGLPLPSCRTCPPGVSVGPVGVEPAVLVYVCVHP